MLASVYVDTLACHSALEPSGVMARESHPARFFKLLITVACRAMRASRGAYRPQTPRSS